MNFEDESKGGLIGTGAEDMQIDRLEGVKLRISEIDDIASVKVS